MLLPHWLSDFSQKVLAAGTRGGRQVRTSRTRGLLGGRIGPVVRQIELLETRVLLAAATPLPGELPGANQPQLPSGPAPAAKLFPAQTDAYLTSSVLTGGGLSGPSAAAPADIAQEFLRSHAVELGLQATDVAGFRVSSVTTSGATGVTNVYLRQQFHGIDIDQGDANVSILPNGQVLAAGARLFPALAERLQSTRMIDAPEAIRAAARTVGVTAPVVGQIREDLGGVAETRIYGAGNVSQRDIQTKLVYQLGADGGLHLSWNLNLQAPGSADWFDMNVSAASGEVLRQDNWTHYSNAVPAPGVKFDTGAGNGSGSATGSSAGATSAATNSASGVPNTGTYNVFQIPVEAPHDGNRTLQVDPADPVASPFGWHDTNGTSGAEFTDTRGNNVFAQEDRDDNDSGGNRPDGGSTLNFDFALDLTQAPTDYESAAITQLFYMNNLLHDIHYHYGFDEASGNFQVNNYGRGGLGNDALQADAQDGSGFNNANMSTPPDGFSPRMQQYIFTITNPDRDSDLDNGIIIHEFGHGVSNRLTGGPANANALDALQSGGMGEGWSDFWSLMFLQRSSDTQNAGYGLGTYVLGQTTTGPGIRRYPYSYNMSINPLTYGDFNTSNEVHDSGEIWASVLWDLNWLLINKHGFSSDLYSGEAGNNLTLQLVMDGLKLQPANPSFLDGRDAILAADLALTGGANSTEIWQAFARRGMGFSASDGGSANATVVTEAFDLPATPTGTVAFDLSSYRVGDSVGIELRDSDLIAQPTVNVSLTSSSGDVETVTLNSVGAGVFRGSITTAAGTGTGNSVLNVAPADTITVTYQDASDGSENPATVTDTASIALELPVFLADFSDDAGNPSLDGFTINNSGSTNAGQWHQSVGRGNQAGHSADDSLYYGEGEGPNGGGTYSNSSGGRVISPVIRVPETNSPFLRFNYFLATETQFDVGRVVLVRAGLPDVVLATTQSDLANPSSGWKTFTFDLADYLGDDVQFRFEFTTNATVSGEGWYIDDVEVAQIINDFGQLQGTAFNDFDGDGAFDAGEPVRAGWQVYLDQNNNGEFDNNLLHQTFESPNVPISLPDLSTAFSTVQISGMGTVSDVNVKLNLDHTYDADLDIYLISPTGVVVELSTDNGGFSDNYRNTVFDDEATLSITSGSAPFTGRYRPEQPLDGLDGISANGIWILRITDDLGQDSGILYSWSLEITTGAEDPYLLTGVNGTYSFDYLAPGIYSVRDVLPPDYERTAPASGVYLVTLAQNEVREDLDFGSRDPMQRPVFTSPSAVDVPENTTSVVTVTADDADVPAQLITFTITGGADRDYFTLTSIDTLIAQVGLSFITAPDYETPSDFDGNNVYEVQITADDNNGGTTIQNLRVTVTPVNDNSPRFTTTSSPHVLENTTAVLTVIATDADLPAQSLTYSIVDGADQSFFDLTSTGVLSFKTPPDFENPQDSDRNNDYLVQVKVDDGNGRSTLQNITVFVDDADGKVTGKVYNDVDGDGVLDQGEVGLSGWEVVIDTLQTTTVASKQVPNMILDGMTSTSSLTVQGQGTIADLNVQIDIDHTYDADLDIFLISPGGTLIELTTDNGGAGNSFDQTLFDDEAAQSVIQGIAPFRGSYRPESLLSVLDGTSANGTWSLRITDDKYGDRGTLFSWSIQIRTLTGQETTTTDAQGNYVFDTLPEGSFAVRSILKPGFDRTNPVSGAYDFNLAINEVRNDLNFGIRAPLQAPVFTSTATPSVPENSTSVLTVTATDADLPAQTITYSITGGADQSRFSITPQGVLTFKAAPNFELPTDQNQDNVYLVQVTADDGTGGKTTQDLSVTVTNVTETDLRVNYALTDGGATLALQYEIASADSAPFDLVIYRSVDDQLGGDVVLGTRSITAPADLAIGTHLVYWPLGAGTGLLPLPGAGSTDPDFDYFLLAAADPADVVVEEGSSADNVSPVVGLYKLGTGPLMLQGTSDVDNLGVVVTTGVEVTVNGQTVVYPAGSITSLRARGHGGNDIANLSALPVASLIHGGSGNDTFTGGNSADTIYGGPGDDVISGNSGNDVLVGEAGDDQLNGGTGNDTYAFDTDSVLGTDTLTESSGTETLDFSGTTSLSVAVDLSLTTLQVVNANLSLLLGSGAAFENLTGGLLGDSLLGNSLANTLIGGAGDDLLGGGAGNDTYPIDADTPTGSDTIAEGVDGGIDHINYSLTTTRGVALDLSLITQQIVNSNSRLTLSAGDVIENLTGGGQGDVLAGNSLANTLIGGAGIDSLSGAGGPDILTGGAANDSLAGGEGDDVYLFDADANLGSDTLVEEATVAGGNDLLDFAQTTGVSIVLDLASTALQTLNANLKLQLSSGAAFEMVVGTSKNDTILGNSLNNVLLGGPGDDTLSAFGGRDLVFGGTGADTLSGGDDDDILIAGTTTYYNESTRVLDRTAIRAIVAEWVRGDLAYSERIAHLRNGGGLNGNFRLNNLTLLSDGIPLDSLTGGDGLDWFWKFGSDVITDLNTGGAETVN